MPQILGHEMSGTISAVGPEVDGFSLGERVTVMPLDPCHRCPACRAGHQHICQNLKFLGIDTPGALQSYWTVPAHTLHRLPAQLSLVDAALIEPLAVACHDTRLGEVRAGEYVVVLGGGPIGALIGLVAQSLGSSVLVSEVNPFRLSLLHRLGLTAVNPQEHDLVEYVNAQTGGAGADVVFEVTASEAAAQMMTRLPRTRGRLVIVGVFSQPAKVDLFRFFWRELRLCGARVYEHQDFEAAIHAAASGAIPVRRLITQTCPLDNLDAAFRLLESGGDVMKVLINCEWEVDALGHARPAQA